MGDSSLPSVEKRDGRGELRDDLQCDRDEYMFSYHAKMFFTLLTFDSMLTLENRLVVCEGISNYVPYSLDEIDSLLDCRAVSAATMTIQATLRTCHSSTTGDRER
jgi:hypothetical protein